MTNYTIQSGDNLTKIAKAHNTTVSELARINNISDPNKIQAGKTIVLFEQQVEKQQMSQAYDTLEQQLAETQRQYSSLQQQMNNQQEASFNGLDMFGYGLAGAATYKIGEKVLPHAWNTTKAATNVTYNAGKNAGKVIANVATNTGRATANITKNTASKVVAQAKHVAKKVELEYAFGKDAVKQGVNKVATSAQNAGNAIARQAKHVAKKVELEYAFGKDAVKQGIKTATSKSGKIMTLTKAGKAVGKRLPVVGITIAAVETYQAGKEGGAKAAVKQGVKSASGLACGAAGAKIGAIAGACTGPAAPIAVPVLTVVGGVVGYIGGEKLVDKISSWFE